MLEHVLGICLSVLTTLGHEPLNVEVLHSWSADSGEYSFYYIV